MAGVAIDLALLYLARSELRRAGGLAGLSGTLVIVDSGCRGGVL